MFDRRKLQAQMVLKGYNVSQVAEMLGINSATMYRKLGNDGDFSRTEINQLIDILDIEDIRGIFFAPSIASMQQGEEG
jgi:DNA-binding phage protein